MSDSLKRRRRALASALNKPAVASYVPHLDLEIFAFIKDFLESGSAGVKAIEPLPLATRFSLSVALTIDLRFRFASTDDKLFQEIMEVEHGIVSIRNRTQNLMDYIPLLRLNLFSARGKQSNGGKGEMSIWQNLSEN